MTLLALQEYWRDMAAAHPELADFVVGDSEAILSRDRSSLQYPCLWLETPEVSWRTEQGRAVRTYALAWAVLWNRRIEDPAAEQWVLDKTLEITGELLARLADDIEEVRLPGVTWPQHAADTMPIQGYGVDNDHGWRTTLRLDAPATPCPPCSALWGGSSPALQASFEWTNMGTGNNFDISVLPISPSAGAWQYSWSYKLGSANTVDAEPVGAIGAGSVLFITLMATLGSITLLASAIVPPGRACGGSVPGLYSPPQVL